MQKAPAANESFARVLTENDTVDIAQISILVAPGDAAGRGRAAAILACIGNRVGNSLRRRRMRRQKVGCTRVDGGGGLLRLELGVVLHRGEKAHGPEGVVAGPRGDTDADPVSLEFLRAREACQRELRLGERERPDFRIADHVRDHTADQRRLLGLLFAKSRHGARRRGPSRAPAPRPARIRRWRAPPSRG